MKNTENPALKGMKYLRGMAKKYDDQYAHEAVCHIEHFVKHDLKRLEKLETIDLDEVISGLEWKIGELDGTSVDLTKTYETLALVKELR